jgi:acetylornithine deacetylase/succinyl-diaminopimelate desuccinylase-like protein
VHYDGQPVDPTAWTNAPFEPVFYDKSMEDGGQPIPAPKKGEVIRDDWRIYARSTSDDKAPAIALMAAIDALEEASIGYTSNIKLFLMEKKSLVHPIWLTILKNIKTYLKTLPFG